MDDREKEAAASANRKRAELKEGHDNETNSYGDQEEGNTDRA